jgi:glycyl-tRNA synthetase beta chain
VDKDLLIEIGFENLPCRYLSSAIKQLEDVTRNDLKTARLEYSHLKVMGTPNRLVLNVKGLADRQSSYQKRVVGPPVSAGISSDGEYTRAAEGFAESQDIDVDQLIRVDSDKGEYLAAVKEIRGDSTVSVLKIKVPQWIQSIKFPKVMRWDDSGFRFARPVRWVLSFFGDKVVRFRVGNVGSGNITRLSIFSEKGVEVNGIDDYFTLFRSSGIILDRDKRREMVTEQACREAESQGGKLVEDEGLVDDVTNLVESPVAMTGRFEDSFLRLPREVIVTALKSHQRYFSVEGQDGKLKPLFVAFADGGGEDTDTILKGYERVLQARLADAEFYFEEDTSCTLEEMSRKLEGIVWLEGLGTLADKVKRIESLAVMFQSEWGIKRKGFKDDLKRAALLAKADLASEMVKDGKEFTLLQGYIGREYARVSGEREAVAEAIFEHYLPRFSGDDIPGGDVGALVGLADKIDTITGCYLMDMIPTGSQDPYALRRSALGVLRILIEREIPVSFPQAVKASINAFEKMRSDYSRLSLEGGSEYTREMAESGERATISVKEGKGREVAEKIKEFVNQRFSVMLREKGYDHDLVSAALVATWEYPAVVKGVASSLQKMRKEKTLDKMVLAMKRIGNIIPSKSKGKTIDQASEIFDSFKNKKDEELSFSVSLFSQEEERELFDEMSRAASEILSLDRMEKHRCIGILNGVVSAVNIYFDGVMVNCKEPKVRKNRLAFLESVHAIVSLYCDFSAVM